MCRHPLNCEPPLSMLMERGFITPVSLHYVRNHGAVPKLDWDTHKVKVCVCHQPQCLAADSPHYCPHHVKAVEIPGAACSKHAAAKSQASPGLSPMSCQAQPS